MSKDSEYFCAVKYGELRRFIRLVYNFVQSHQPQQQKEKHMSDPITEVNQILADYQALLTAYNGALAQIATLTAAAGTIPPDTASKDLQAEIDAALAFAYANPPPTPPAPTASPMLATPSTPAPIGSA